MEIAMTFARHECTKFRDPSNKDPIDEDDVAFMYLVGYMAGKGHVDIPETKRAAVVVAHHFMHKGQYIAERHFRTPPQDVFRFSLE